MELEALDYDHTLHENRTKGDSKLYVRFFPGVAPDVEESARTGIKKFRDVDFITIMVPGDKRNIITREARPGDIERFKTIYDQYKGGQSEVLNGYPLSQWPLVSRAMVEELKYLGFMTVEHVANASDASAGRHPGLRELQRRAQSWLQAQKDAAPIEQLNSALEQRDQEIIAMKAQLEEMSKMMSQLQKQKS